MISVIIPLYNKAPYVQKALKTVCAQTYRDWECIIMDDGSTDGSGELVEKLTAELSDTRFVVLHQANAGVSTARNNAVLKSSGEYLCFLDADDWWEPNYLEEMIRLSTQYSDAGIYGANYYYVRRGRNIVRIDHPTGYMDYFKQYAEGPMPLWTGAVMMPRRIFDEFGGFPNGMVLGEDQFLWLQVVLKYKMAWLNKPLAYYNNDVDQATRGIVKDKIYKPDTFLTFRLDYFEEAERTRPEVKLLFDRLRVYSLERYLEQKAYPALMRKEIAKVDWRNVSAHFRRLYNWPYPLIKAYFVLHRIAYNIYCRIRKR